MKPFTLFLLLLCLLPLAGRADDWPQWRGPNRTDVSKETGLLKEWPKEGPKLLWTYEAAGVGYSGFAVVGTRLYTMGAFEDTEAVYALDTTTGKKVWAIDIGKLLTNNWGDGPRGTPTVDGDYLYALSGQGNLVCLKASDGSKMWSKTLTSDLGGNKPNWGYTESPLVDGDLVVCSPGGNKGTIAALNKKDGTLVWQSKELKDQPGYSSLIIANVGGVKQYVKTTMSAIVGVRASDGKLLWRHERKGYRTAVIPTPIFHDNYVYATAGYNAGCDLLKLTPEGQDSSKDGTKYEVVYTNDNMVNQHGGVVLVGDYLYGYSDKGGWVCQEFKTGKSVWKERGIGKGSLTCADGRLYCYSERDGTVALVEASPSGWKEHGNFKIPRETKQPRKSGHIWTHPVVANGKLFIRDQDLIFCFDVKDAQR